MGQKSIITSPGCGGCHAVKEMLKPLLDDGTITEKPVTTDEGKTIAKELNLKTVPECVEQGPDGKWSVCDLEDLLDEADDRRGKKADEHKD